MFIFHHSNMFLFNIGNKIFCFFKKWVFPFLDKGPFQLGELSSWNVWGGLFIKGGSDRFRFFFFGGGEGGGGLGKNGGEQYFRVRLIPWRILCFSLSFTCLNILIDKHNCFVNTFHVLWILFTNKFNSGCYIRVDKKFGTTKKWSLVMLYRCLFYVV